MISSTRPEGLLAAHPRLGELAAATTAGDRGHVAAELEALSLSHPHDFWTGCSVVGDAPGAGVLIEAWHRDEPQDPVVLLLEGHHGVHAAWDIRSSRQAQHVSAEQFDAFHARLETTERVLLELCAREPELPDPWAVRLTSCRGLELGESESARRYARLAALDPHHLAGQRARLQQLLPKWGAPDFTDAHAHARACAMADRPDLGVDVLFADLALEQWAFESGRKSVPPSMRSDLDIASDRVLGATLSAEFDGFGVHSAFAVAHSLARDEDRAVAHLQRLGDAIDPLPVGYLGKDERRRIERLRAKARRGGGAR